jgi:hypothetical protein
MTTTYADFENHVLDDGHTFFVGQLPASLRLEADEFESLWAIHPDRYHVIVCGDFAYYQFPKPEFWQRLFDESPSTLSFAFKVPDTISMAKWPTPRDRDWPSGVISFLIRLSLGTNRNG